MLKQKIKKRDKQQNSPSTTLKTVEHEAHILHTGTLLASNWFGYSQTVRWGQQSGEGEPMVPTQWTTMNRLYTLKITYLLQCMLPTRLQQKIL